MPSGTDDTTPTPSMPPFCTPWDAQRPGERHASRLQVEDRALLGRTHQHLGPAAAGHPHLQAARGVGGGQDRLGERGVVAVDEHLLGAVDGDRLGVAGQPAQAEPQFQRLLDRALGHRAGHADLASDQQRDRIGRRVAQHRNRRLDLAESVGDGAGRVGGDEQRVVELVGDVGLVARRSPGAHLAHRHLHLDGGEQRDDAGQFGRGGAADQPHDVGATDVDVDHHSRQRHVVERHRLRRHLEVQPVAGDELVDDVEVLGRLAVEFDDDPVAHHE